MSDLSPRERLLRTLRKEEVDRPPVICPGGMMNSAIVEVMSSTGHTLPDAHSDPALMAALADDIREATGFENTGVPFCMTVEAEALGSCVTLGSLECEPKIASEAFASAEAVEYRDVQELTESDRVRTVAGAVSALREKETGAPVVGCVTGAISLAASLVDPVAFLKSLRKRPDSAHAVLDYVVGFLEEYARLLVQSGADVISIGDPTATGEILGPRMFGEYAKPYNNRLIDAIHSVGAPVILHICGDISSVRGQIPEMRADAISVDAMVNLGELKREYPQITTMGNLSTFALQFGPPEKIAKKAQSLVEDGVDIISPACGLSTSTTLENIRALTSTVKRARPVIVNGGDLNYG